MQSSTNEPSFNASLLERVREGMHVVDAAGRDVGRVQEVSMGDPEATTTAGNETRGAGGLLADVARAVSTHDAEPDVPEPLRSRLVRGGYLRIDGPGLVHTNRYVSGDRVAEVSGDRVRLRVDREHLIREDER